MQSLHSIYLSVDLDFWIGKVESPVVFFDHLLDTVKDVSIVVEHQDLIPHASQFDFDTLVNIDYHSDVTEVGCTNPDEEKTLSDIDCGEWVNFVPGRSQKQHLWICPKIECHDGSNNSDTYGLCNADHRLNPFATKNAMTGWRSHKVAVRRPSINSNISNLLFRAVDKEYSIVAAGIAISPDFSRLSHIEWMDRYMHSRHLKFLQNNQTQLYRCGEE